MTLVGTSLSHSNMYIHVSSLKLIDIQLVDASTPADSVLGSPSVTSRSALRLRFSSMISFLCCSIFT